MTPERVVAAVVGTLLLIIARRCALRALRELGSPVDVLTLYLTLWGGVLVLFAIPLIAYTTTPFVAWIAIYGAIAAGAGACWLMRWRSGSAVVPDVDDRAATVRDAIDPGRLRAVWVVCAVLGALGLLAFVYAVSRVLPWTAVVSDPEAVREVKTLSSEFQETYGVWKLLTYFNQVAFILWTIALRVGAFNGRWRRLRFAGAVSLLPFLLTADRGLLVATVAWAGMLHIIWPQRIAVRRAAVLVAAGVLVVGLAVSVVGNRYGGSLGNHPDVAAALNTRVADPVAIPYLYLTANIPTFGRLTQDHLAPLNLGAMTLLPFAKLGEESGLSGRAPIGTGVFYPIPFEDFSNYSWLGSFWLDFRLPGVLFLSALIAAIAAAAHLWTLRAPSVAALWVASVLLYVLVFSPFANALSATLTWQFLLLTPVVALIVDDRLFAGLRARVRAAGGHARLAGAGAALAACALAGAFAIHLRGGAGTAAPALDADRELAIAIAKVRSLHRELGRYPQANSIATRLQVNGPDMTFRSQSSFAEPVVETGIIAVFSQPQDVFLRMRGRDGRLYEVHRTEDWGGWTFGPGTRDE
ncbi:MAG: hypothetical protein M3376_04185 [Actinomycetota bacterium]|nr:hypothetical protein [Actinomycetota bacterium]